MQDSISNQAPAKLNLALSVGAPRADGMHPICSWMVAIDLCDNLEVTKLSSNGLSRYAILWHEDAKRKSEIDWSIRDDLAVKAHLALERHVGETLPLQMKLEKKIPVGGGLGGGSSNAAAMLCAVNQLYNLDLNDETLREIAADLGSDVPFFIKGGSAIIHGMGERVELLGKSPAINAVVVFPDFSCPTGGVYQAFDEFDESPVDEEAVRSISEDWPVEHDRLFNDLCKAAINTSPKLESYIDSLSNLAERQAHLAGSGSSIFVICDDAIHAEALAEAIEEQHGLPAIAVSTV